MANSEHLEILGRGVEPSMTFEAVSDPSPRPRLRPARVLREACGEGETEVSPP